jgi:hypothetical protein
MRADLRENGTSETNAKSFPVFLKTKISAPTAELRLWAFLLVAYSLLFDFYNRGAHVE